MLLMQLEQKISEEREREKKKRKSKDLRLSSEDLKIQRLKRRGGCSENLERGREVGKKI